MLWLQNFVVTVLIAIGCLLPLVVIGFDRLRALEGWDPTTLQQLGWDLLDLVRETGPALVAGLLAATVVWTLAGILFAWFQAGFFGVLVSADRQAPPGAPRDWRAFRTFSWSHFTGWAGRYLWRFFWFWNLYFLLITLWLLLAVVLGWGSYFGFERWGGWAAAGIGCGGALPLFFLLFVLSLWLQLATADLARQGSSLRVAAANGFRVLLDRPAAVLLIVVVFILAALLLVGLMMAVFLPLRLVVQASGSSHLGVVIALETLSQIVQWLVSGLVTTTTAAAWVALMSSEVAGRGRRADAAVAPEAP